MTEKKKKIIVILGTTASHKSGFAVSLAKKFGVEIISADSRQVYTGLDIGTGKITKKEMCAVPHHLLDVANPKKRFSVMQFKALAEKAIDEITKRGRVPIICGGTGFYIQALVDGIILPEVTPNKKLRTELLKKSNSELFRMLQKLDPKRAQNIDAKNPHRLIRAIEIAKALGKVPKISKSSKYNPLFIGLTLPSNELRGKINSRLHARIKKGMISEAKRLHARGLSWKRMNELGLEYRFLSLHLQGKISKEEMTKQLQAEIWHYAKRQLTWFKRDPRIHWFSPADVKKIQKAVGNFLRK